MQPFSLNIKPTNVKSPKPAYKGQSRLKEYSNKSAISHITPLEENFELFDLCINGQELGEGGDIGDGKSDPLLETLSESSLLKLKPLSDVKQTKPKFKPKHSLRDHREVTTNKTLHVIESNLPVIDLTPLRSEYISFDCVPFRNVYNYESRFDLGGIINFTLTTSIEGRRWIFPRELEYQELSTMITKKDKLMYYLLGKDKYNFFELSRQRDHFYDFECLALTEPLIFPGYENVTDHSEVNTDTSELEDCRSFQNANPNSLEEMV